ncbi:MAG: DNA ligase D [Burkholderiaceae bacterium]|nr:DNA ligase D [Burkholderiaceae bacterium]
MPDRLQAYKAKRDFSITPEPSARGKASRGAHAFVIQKHWATRLHYDFRIELDGVMKSWAIPKGPSLDPRDKRMAVHVEDHPISYNGFEGEIPAKQYGAGKVIVWDNGTWEPLGDPHEAYRAGHLRFSLHGHKLAGNWALIRMRPQGEKKEAWLLVKEKDEYARPAKEFSVIDELPDSVLEKSGSARTSKAASNRKTAKTTQGNKNSAAVKGTPRHAGMPDMAKKADLPERLSPQLATLADQAPEDDEAWQYEIKFDGYRLLTRIDSQSQRLFTRSGHDWTAKLPSLAKSVAGMHLPEGWYDGEIVVLNEDGIPDFQRLQNAFDRSNTKEIIYYLFDLPYCRGYDLRAAPLVERRRLLQSLLHAGAADAVRFSQAFEVPGAAIKEDACRMGLEGVIGKRLDSPYVERRSPAWIKLKCRQRQEFVIGGYTDPQGMRSVLGSLLLGVHDAEGKLRYVGNVGSGFDQASLARLRQQLDAVAAADSPFSGPTGGYRKVHWVKPVLLAEVTFAAWTADRHIRHSVFHALRSDKQAAQVIREEPVSMRNKKNNSASGGLPASQKITHPERIIDESTGITKLDLMRYYALIAPLMLPHLKGRPVSLVRAPDGIGGQLFFQKHLGDIRMKGVKALNPALDPDHPPLLEIAAAEGLLQAEQMNVIEFHTWNAVKTMIAKPDRMTFDLDPGAGTTWDDVRQAAMLVQSLLGELKLETLLKTSGGKGLHIIVPIKRQYGWDTVKDFTHAIVNHLAETLPKQFAAKSGPKNRVGKIFVDYLRNGFGATTVAAWSARARPGMGVSVPISWRELEKIKESAQWNVRNIHARLDRGNDPWDELKDRSQGITRAMKILGNVCRH